MRKSTLTLVAYFVLTITNISAQFKAEYYENLAFYLSEIGYLELADSTYDLASKLQVENVFSPRHFLLRAKLKANLGDSLKSVFYLKKSIEQGIRLEKLKNEITKNKKLQNFGWPKIIETEYDSLYYQFYKSSNKSEIDYIQKLLYMDQSVRNLYYSMEKNDTLLKNTEILINRMDDLVEKEILKSFSRQLPKMKDVGYESFDKLSLLFIHLGSEQDSFYLKFEPILRKSVEESGFPAKYYANFVDFYRSSNSLPELYGREMFDEIDGKNYYKLFFEPQNIDNRRKEIGLQPLYFHAKFWGAELPEGYSFDLEKFLAELRREINETK